MRRSTTRVLVAVMALVIGACSDSNGVSFTEPDTAGEDSTTTPSLEEPTVSIPSRYGDDEILDRAWDICAQGDLQACDELWWNSPPGSEYAVFGDTCGNTKPAGGWCVLEVQPVAVEPEPGDLAAADPGAPVAAPAGPDLNAPKPPVGGGFVPPAGAGVPAAGNPGMGAIPGGLNPPPANPPAGNPGGGMAGLAVTYGDDPALDALWDDCGNGDWAACDQLFADAPADSHYQAWGFTCGNRIAHSNGDCTTAQGAGVAGGPGDDAALDFLWNACSQGFWAECDQLVDDAPPNSTYWRYGRTCGNRDAESNQTCAARFMGDHGSNPHFDALWDRCAQHDWSACDQLYDAAPDGSDYQEFGEECGQNLPVRNPFETCLKSLGQARNYGDSWYFDTAYDICLDMEPANQSWGSYCDELYNLAPVGSQYESIGGSCGLRTDGYGTCDLIFGSPNLNALMLRCDKSDWVACDDLYREAPIDSYYEWFGLTCGDRSVPASGTCTDR